MSAAISVTSGRRARDRRTATPAGPPAPVTSTRTGAGSDTGALDAGRGLGGDGGGAAPGAQDGTRLADHLERFAVLAPAVAGPVAAGGQDEVVLHVAADAGLRAEAGQQRELGVGEPVDAREPGGPEVDRGRRALVAGEHGHRPRGDGRGTVDGTVVLVPVVRRVRVDDRGLHLGDD